MSELYDRLGQGWYLILLSSALCVSGCFVIFFDDIYKLVFPKAITKRYEFHLRENFTFLNGSLGFSAGCLLFTSLFRLLPEASEYIYASVKEVTPSLERSLNQKLIVSYILGISICLSFNYILHLITSESVIHCNHGPGGEESHQTHTHSHDHSHSHNHGQSHANGYSVGDTSNYKLDLESGPYNEDETDPLDSSSLNDHRGEVPRGNDKRPSLAALVPLDDPTRTSKGSTRAHINDEHSPLIANVDYQNMDRKKSKRSLLHFLTPSGNDVGECKGYSSAELCLYQQDLEVVQHPPHGDCTSIQDGDCDSIGAEGTHFNKPFHFCELPGLSSQVISSDPHVTLAHNQSQEEHECGHEHETEHGHGPHPHPRLHHFQSYHSIGSKPSAAAPRNHVHHDDDHHHHINTPLSRLFLIGVQTTLAITLHKFPEGFITFITSETDPELGLSIFLSLMFHNLTEGFSMCLPLYYSFSESAQRRYSKLKAVLISALLGGLSQPLGALAGYFFLKFNDHHSKDEDHLNTERLNLVFGITLAITSGFLSVVGLSMYGSAVSFNGGSSNFVMVWCLIGMGLIGLSTIVSYE